MPDEPAASSRRGILGVLESYLLARWKKRWPIVPPIPFLVAGWAGTRDQSIVHQQLHQVVIGAVVFVVFVILFPFRWGGEDW